MFCTQCGTKLPDEAIFCTNCGTRISDEAKRLYESAAAPVSAAPVDAPVFDAPVIDTPSSSVYTPPASSSTYIPPSATSARPISSTPEPYSAASEPFEYSTVDTPSYGSASASATVININDGSIAIVDSTKMKWYKFVIYFQLFASAVVNAAMGFLLLTGLIYRILSDGYITADLVYMYFGGLHACDIIFGLLMIALAAWAIFVRFDLAKFEKKAPMKYLALLGAITVISILYAIVSSAIVGQQLMGASWWSGPIVNIALIVLNYIYFNKRKDMFNKEPKFKFL